MAETDEFNVEDQLNYEAETGEGGEGEGDDESADIGDDPELEAIKVCFMHSPNTTQSSEVLGGCTGTPNPHQQTLVVKVTPFTQARVRAMEEESEKLRQLQSEVFATFYRNCFFTDDTLIHQ